MDVTNHSFEHLPDELQRIGDELRAERAIADGHLLERVQRRIEAGRPRTRRTWRQLIPRRPRTIAALLLVLGFGMNVSGAMATVLADCGIGGAGGLNVGGFISSIGNWTSGGDGSQSASGWTYCPTQGITWNNNGTTVNGGMQQGGGQPGYGCCPTGDHTSMQTSGGTTSGGCCLSDQDSYMQTSGGKTSSGCCPSTQTSWAMTSNGQQQSTGCCPTGDSGYAVPYNSTSTHESGCCPTGTTYHANTLGGSNGGSQGGCCASQSSSGGQNYGPNTSGSQQKGCCPPNTKVSLKWHYSSGGSPGSWSGDQSQSQGGSWSWSSQTMEGNLRVAPGAALEVGYTVSAPGNTSPISFYVNNPSAVFTVTCVSGMSPTSRTLTLSMPTQEFSVSDSGWYTGGSAYQGSTTVPNLCHGGQMSLSQGGSFSASWS